MIDLTSYKLKYPDHQIEKDGKIYYRLYDFYTADNEEPNCGKCEHCCGDQVMCDNCGPEHCWNDYIRIDSMDIDLAKLNHIIQKIKGDQK